MENLEPETRPIRPPDPLDPFNPWSKFEPILKYVYRLKESKSRWYPTFLTVLIAPFVLIAGYALYTKLAELKAAVPQVQTCKTEKINKGVQVDVVLHTCVNPMSSFVVINDQPQKSYLAVDKITFSPVYSFMSQSIAYFAYEQADGLLKLLLVRDGKEYEISSPVPLSVDADGAIQTDLSTTDIVFSPDGQRLAYTAYFRGGEDVYVDGMLAQSYRHQPIDENTRCRFYDVVRQLQFSAGNTLLYITSKPANAEDLCKDALVIAGKEYASYPAIGPVTTSVFGTNIAYVGYEEGTPVEGTEFSEGNFYLILNDEKIKTFSFPAEKIYDLAFSYDDRALCYTLGSPQGLAREVYAVIGGREYRLPYGAQASEQDFSSFCSSQSSTLR